MTEKFSLQVDVINWQPFAKIELRWDGASVAVDPANVHNAQLVSSETTASAIVIQLGEHAASPPAFQIMGQGTQRKDPAISCTTSFLRELPPPSPPGPMHCDLQPQYTTKNSWQGRTPGQTVEIKFSSWRDAAFVRLYYWGQTNLQVVGPVHAVVHTTSVVNDGKDSVITLQLGTSCEETVIDSLGVVVAQAGQQMNCVPHRAETMNVAFTLHPAALHPPRISCHDIEPPPPPPHGQAASGQDQINPPADALDGGYAPRFGPPSPPVPAPPPPFLRLGSTVRTSGSDCSISALASVTALEQHDHRMKARIAIQPVAWAPGRIMVLGVSGTELDLGDENLPNERVLHATRLLPPEVDSSGRIVLFKFRLQQTTPAEPRFEVTLKGIDMHLATLSCRPADRQPPTSQQPERSQAPLRVAEEVVVRQAPASFVWFEASVSDITLLSVAVLMILYLAGTRWHAIRSMLQGGANARTFHGFELPTTEEDAGMERRTGRVRRGQQQEQEV